MAYNFVAANVQYLEVADSSALDITGAITLSAWFKSTGSYASNRGIVSKFLQAGNQRSYVFVITGDGIIRFVVSTDGTAQAGNVVSGSTVVGTNWRHGAAILNPSVRQEVFLDGNSESAKTTSVAASIYNSSSNVRIGNQFSDFEINSFDGDIAEVGIWNTALTADEIKSLSAGMTCDKVRPQSLVFYSPLTRDLIDVKGGLTITNNNTATVADHPRVYA